MSLAQVAPCVAAGVVAATGATEAAYVMFTASVAARRHVPAASWSSVWYLLTSFAVAALGSWLGAYAPMTFLHPAPSHPPPPLAPMAD